MYLTGNLFNFPLLLGLISKSQSLVLHQSNNLSKITFFLTLARFLGESGCKITAFIPLEQKFIDDFWTKSASCWFSVAVYFAIFPSHHPTTKNHRPQGESGRKSTTFFWHDKIFFHFSPFCSIHVTKSGGETGRFIRKQAMEWRKGTFIYIHTRAREWVRVIDTFRACQFRMEHS